MGYVPMPPPKLQGVTFEMQELWVCPYCRSLMVFSRTECRNCGAPYLPSDDQVAKVQEVIDRHFDRRYVGGLRRRNHA